jgi:hypothetical protein
MLFEYFKLQATFTGNFCVWFWKYYVPKLVKNHVFRRKYFIFKPRLAEREIFYLGLIGTGLSNKRFLRYSVSGFDSQILCNTIFESLYKLENLNTSESKTRLIDLSDELFRIISINKPEGFYNQNWNQNISGSAYLLDLCQYAKRTGGHPITAI